MDVVAYTTGVNASPVELGSIADHVWTNSFKSTETRQLQKFFPFRAAAPKVFDRSGTDESFSFTAGRSFSSLADTLKFMATHRASVPRLADLQFTSDSQNVWLRACGIEKINLADKRGALIVFEYSIVGGTWGLTRT